MVPPHIELAKTMSQQRLEMITELKAAFQALTSDLISQGKQANGKSMGFWSCHWFLAERVT
jgi:hypothetical protein